MDAALGQIVVDDILPSGLHALHFEDIDVHGDPLSNRESDLDLENTLESEAEDDRQDEVSDEPVDTDAESRQALGWIEDLDGADGRPGGKRRLARIEHLLPERPARSQGRDLGHRAAADDHRLFDGPVAGPQ